MAYSTSLAVGLATASTSFGSVTIGSDLSHAGTADHNCGTGCTVVQTANPVSPLTAPFDGLIVRWRVRDFPTAKVTLRVVNQVSPGGPPYNYSFIRSSSQESSGGGGVQTFTPASPIPISAGDSLGVTSTVDVAGTCGLGAGYSDGIWDMPSDGTTVASFNINGMGCDWLYNADIVGPPTSSAVAAACPGGSSATITVTPDPDPATGPKDVHYKIDGGPELTVATTGDPGVATIPVASGIHSIEFWGEDLLGQQESTHHTITAGCPSLANATISPKSFRTSGPHPGTTISYDQSGPFTMTLTVVRLAVGHKQHGTCRAGLPRPGQKRCTRRITLGSFTQTGATGPVSFPFTGNLNGHTLRPGHYLLELVPIAQGLPGGMVTLTFRVTRAPR